MLSAYLTLKFEKFFIVNMIVVITRSEVIQSVPPIWKHIRTHFSFFLNHICQKVTPDLKSLGKKLSDGTLKPRGGRAGNIFFFGI